MVRKSTKPKTTIEANPVKPKKVLNRRRRAAAAAKKDNKSDSSEWLPPSTLKKKSANQPSKSKIESNNKTRSAKKQNTKQTINDILFESDTGSAQSLKNTNNHSLSILSQEIIEKTIPSASSSPNELRKTRIKEFENVLERIEEQDVNHRKRKVMDNIIDESPVLLAKNPAKRQKISNKDTKKKKPKSRRKSGILMIKPVEVYDSQSNPCLDIPADATDLLADKAKEKDKQLGKENKEPTLTVKQILEQLNMKEYLQGFIYHQVTARRLPFLTEREIQELFPLAGPRAEFRACWKTVYDELHKKNIDKEST